MGHFSSTQRIPVNYSNATWLDKEYRNSSSKIVQTQKNINSFPLQKQ